MGAASLSLKRVGRSFHTAFQLRTAEGDVVNLTGTSPAMLASRLRLAWEARNLAGAKRSLRLADSTRIDFEVARKALADSRLPNQSRSLLTSFLCQTVWSHERLYHVGYDVVQGCAFCDSHRDDLHHRLFLCPCTQHF